MPVSLGRDVFTAGVISRETQSQCLNILLHYKEQLAGWGITPEQTTIIATSAFRESKNKDPVMDKILIATGFRIKVIDGKEALDIYDKEHPDLILLDVMMPGYDGWTVCREIRRESTVPIMMLTAKGEEIDQLFAYDLGAGDGGEHA